LKSVILRKLREERKNGGIRMTYGTAFSEPYENMKVFTPDKFIEVKINLL
jgi:hypothetical protein